VKHLPNLLIVDDSEENLLFLENLLKKIKANLIQTLSGAEALEKTRGIEIALAIIDVRMPEMNGYELALKMNEERSGDKVPIIFITASHATEMQVFKGYGSGAVDYLVKPVDNHILLCKVNVFLDLFNHKQTIKRDMGLLKKSTDEVTRVNAAIKKSEEKYRLMIETTHESVVVAQDGLLKFVNPMTLSLLGGYSEKELIDRPFSEFIHPDDRSMVLENYRRRFTKEAAQSRYPFRVVTRDGIVHWVEINATLIEWQGKPATLNFLANITERKQAEDALRESEEQHRMLIEASFDLIYVIGRDDMVEYANPAALRALRKSAAEVIGKPRASFFPPAVAAAQKLALDQLFTSGESLSREQKTELAGIVQYQETQLIPLKGADGKTVSVLGISRDITERKLSEEALKESEALLRSVVCNIIELIIITDENGIVSFISPQCESVTGYPPGKFIGKRIPDIIHPDDFERCQIAWNQVFQEEPDLREFEYRILDGQGAIRWISHSAKRIRINDSLFGMQNTIRNITERKIAEQTLRISEEKYRTMLNASPDGILLIDLKGTITEVSEIGLELFGTETRDDIVGKDIFRFVPSGEKNTLKEIIEKATNEGLAQNIELKIRKKNQSIFEGEISATLIQSPDGAPLSFMIIIRDISHRKKMETKQIHADRMANLGEMASGIAHEINQPLNIISMVMDKILFESAKTETIDMEFLKNKSNKIFDNITRIRNIIDHIRAFSRSHDDFVLSAFDINSSIENAASMIMEQFKHLGISLNLQLEKQIPQIVGNTYRFEQVIINLLVNAKDAVIEKKSKQEKYIEMIVGVRSYQEHQFLIVEVTDNGIGISHDDINNIILPFYTTKDEGKGTGIGLSICYQIIKEMDGTIEITSDKLHGTKIKIILDIQKKK